MGMFLDGVQRHSGQRFTEEQVAAAVAGRPDRILIQPEG
jgi:hypothetical protein